MNRVEKIEYLMEELNKEIFALKSENVVLKNEAEKMQEEIRKAWEEAEAALDDIKKQAEKRCKNCAFFKIYKDINVFTNKETIGPHGECTCPKLRDTDTGKEVGRDELVYSYDTCGGFDVGPVFGCVHFKEREVGK